MTAQLISLCRVEDLLLMRSLYERNWPEHYLGYNTLDNFISWRKNNSNNNTNNANGSNEQQKLVDNFDKVRILSLNEQSWRERGLYLIVHEYQLFVNSTLAEDSELAIALCMLDWSRGYKITSVPRQQYNTIRGALQTLNIKWLSAPMNVYRLAGGKALQRSHSQLPPDLTLRSLRPNDAEAVNMAWPSRHTGSLQFLKCLIANNESIALCCANTNTLIAWCTRCQCGFLGTLHVQPSHRRRGIATLVVDALAYRIAVANTRRDVFALVYEHNVASNELFRKLDYELIENVYHIRAFHNPSSFE